MQDRRDGEMRWDEDWQLSRSPHRPLHVYAGGEYYWITAATLKREPHFAGPAQRRLFSDELYSAAEAWKVELAAWTLLSDHYHAIIRPAGGGSLARFIGRLHGCTARQLNRQDGARGRQIWRQYWDTLLRSEGDFWSRVNYVWWNPVKHGYCSRPEEWPWTNLHALMAEQSDSVSEPLSRFPAPARLPGDQW